MKRILHIISSPRGDASFSIKLGRAIVERIVTAYPGSTVKETDLVKKHWPHLEEAHITSFYTPAEKRTPADQIAIQHSDEAISEIMDADIIVIGAPLYNFSIHSTLKAWIDHIVRSEITFKVDENVPAGLVNNKKVYIALASGWVYSEGEMKAMDFVAPYLTAILSFLGMKDLTIFRVEGTAIPGNQDTALARAIDSVKI